MTRRFILASVRHESNTFSPHLTQLEHFNRGSPEGSLMTGSSAIEVMAQQNASFAGMYDTIKDRGAEISVPCAFSAAPQGPVTSTAFDEICRRILSDVEKGCDALFLDTHGAMVSDTYSDAEGELLRRIRAIFPELPIAVALDFHANISSTLIDNVTTIAGYRTYPHTDTYETGQRASRVLVEALNGDVVPVVSWGALPLLTHMERQTPLRQPMKDIMDRAIQAEADGEVLLASVLGGFPLADIPHLGLTVVIVTDTNKPAGDALRDELLDIGWRRRKDFLFDNEPVATSIARAKRTEGQPIVLVDHGDNQSAGGQTDNMDVLAELLHQGLEDVCAGPFCDRACVEQMIARGEGSEITLELGGKWDIPKRGLKGRPLALSGTIRTIRDGKYQRAAYGGRNFYKELGATAVLDLGPIQVLVSSQPYEPVDPGCFVYAGIEPAQKKFILIKSRQNFRPGFEPMAEEIIMVAGPGVGNSNFHTVPYRNICRPIYPIDLDTPKVMKGN